MKKTILNRRVIRVQPAPEPDPRLEPGLGDICDTTIEYAFMCSITKMRELEYELESWQLDGREIVAVYIDRAGVR